MFFETFFFYIVMDSVSPFITIGEFCVNKRWGYLISFKCAQIDQIIFSVSGSNQSVTFTQIIIFQVHNNYQKELNGSKLSPEIFDSSCREPYILVGRVSFLVRKRLSRHVMKTEFRPQKFSLFSSHYMTKSRFSPYFQWEDFLENFPAQPESGLKSSLNISEFYHVMREE